MAQDPAFLFYPGDYLRDTQCLSEKAQVAYDRLMCEHMRSICISEQRLNFFTKKLTDHERQELMSVLVNTDDGYRIQWVYESVSKRKSYNEGRRKNAQGSKNKNGKAYAKHMENEIENEIEDINGKKGGVGENMTDDLAVPYFQKSELDWQFEKSKFVGDTVWQERFTKETGVKEFELKTLVIEFLRNIELQEDYKTCSELKKHFTNWWRKNKKADPVNLQQVYTPPPRPEPRQDDKPLLAIINEKRKDMKQLIEEDRAKIKENNNLKPVLGAMKLDWLRKSGEVEISVEQRDEAFNDAVAQRMKELELNPHSMESRRLLSDHRNGVMNEAERAGLMVHAKERLYLKWLRKVTGIELLTPLTEDQKRLTSEEINEATKKEAI